ncbi:MAG: hypothetical protein F4110_14620 [Acidimicrobiaceae bacterium]|nr:hypothetical protein [Acidimicrobiaceae bacterium]MYE98338.1 hypothetical protein [Acidimicrobiaceae bacterium]MYI55190.1 hypothetical protein [Acidimicrobiaceae bacterium]
MMELRPGARFQSTVCANEVIVVKGAGPAELSCGGAPLAAAGSAERSGDPGDASEGTLLGKRYGDEDEAIEVLCTKAGPGSLALGGVPLAVKVTNSLPASD